MNDRILRRYQQHSEREADIAKLARVIDGGSDIPTARGTRLTGHRSAEGDPVRLRGIPSVARGVPGNSTESAALLRQVENQPLSVRRQW